MIITITLKDIALLLTLQVIIAFTTAMIVQFINYDPYRPFGLIGYNEDRNNPGFFKKIKFFIGHVLGKNY